MSSIDANVTRLWQIRTVEVTIWTFALSVGLGQFSGGKISLALLLVSFGIPFVFITIDRRLNSWYLTMRKRSQQITAYINDSDRLAYLSKTGQKFPLFDPEMKFTKSGMKSAEDKPDQTGGIDWNILCFYGGQLVISAAIILFVYYGIVTGKYEGPPKPEFSPIVSDIPLVK